MENDITPFEEKRRTISQNRALHLWYEQLAKTLNEEGKSMQMVLNKFVVDAPVTKNSVKELIWRPLQEALLGKISTTELLKKEEIDQVYEALVKFFGQELEVQVPPFPSQEEVFYRQLK